MAKLTRNSGMAQNEPDLAVAARTCDDLGTTLGRRHESNGIEIVAGDMVPKWHAKTGKLLSTGPTVRYKRNAAGAEVKISQNDASSRTAYSVYDPQQRTWSAWDTIVMPDDP